MPSTAVDKPSHQSLTELRARATLGVALAALLLLAPFAVISLAQQKYAMAVGTAGIVFILAANVWIVATGRSHQDLTLFGLVPAGMLFMTQVFSDSGLAGTVWCYPAILVRVIDEQHRQMQRQLRRDFLTGLSNRLQLMESLDRCVSDRRIGERCWALLALDLDNFKAVNDRFGHEAGDEVLRAIGALLPCSPGDGARAASPPASVWRYCGPTMRVRTGYDAATTGSIRRRRQGETALSATVAAHRKRTSGRSLGPPSGSPIRSPSDCVPARSTPGADRPVSCALPTARQSR